MPDTLDVTTSNGQFRVVRNEVSDEIVERVALAIDEVTRAWFTSNQSGCNESFRISRARAVLAAMRETTAIRSSPTEEDVVS
jgi:hypothetical protein